jgi:DNA (cytosine-5)-methyltransferase 1
LGWTPAAFCEIDRFPCRVLAHHYPDVPNLGDFTKVDWTPFIGNVDICVGGTPCQAFSVAGLRNSLADERGNLTLEFVRAINIIRPHTVVWENVPGVFSTGDNAFGCFLGALVGSDEPIVFEQGWPNAGVVDGPERRAAWRVLDAQYFGLAQRRKRVFVVANSGDRPHPAEILLEWEGLRRDSPPSRTAGEGVAGTVAARTKGGGGLGTDFECGGGTVAMCLNGGGRIDAESETFVAYPLQLTTQGSGGNLPFGAETDPRFCLTRQGCHGVAHSLRADGFDASEDGTGRGTPLVPVAWDEELNASEDISGSIIRGGDGGRHAGVAVPRDPEDYGFHQCDCGGKFWGYMDTVCLSCGEFRSGTVTYPAMAVHGTQDPCVSDIGFALGRNNGQENAVTTLAIRGRGDESSLEYRTDGTANALLTPNGGRGGIGVGAVAYSIQAGAARENPESGPDGVGVQADVAYTLEARQEVQYVARMAVRRITPVECEKLQGFSPGYTNIPGAADGPRYKALGNSFAVTVVAWIGRRIKKAYAND